MPIYEYRCSNGHTFEVLQSMSDDPVSECEECGAPVERVFHPIAVHFKGSGFYNTDYKNKEKAGAASKGSEGGDPKPSDDSPSKSDSKSSDSKSSDSKKTDSGKAKSGSGSD